MIVTPFFSSPSVPLPGARRPGNSSPPPPCPSKSLPPQPKCVTFGDNYIWNFLAGWLLFRSSVRQVPFPESPPLLTLSQDGFSPFPTHRRDESQMTTFSYVSTIYSAVFRRFTQSLADGFSFHPAPARRVFTSPPVRSMG